MKTEDFDKLKELTNLSFEEMYDRINETFPELPDKNWFMGDMESQERIFIHCIAVILDRLKEEEGVGVGLAKEADEQAEYNEAHEEAEESLNNKEPKWPIDVAEFLELPKDDHSYFVRVYPNADGSKGDPNDFEARFYYNTPDEASKFRCDRCHTEKDGRYVGTDDSCHEPVFCEDCYVIISTIETGAPSDFFKYAHCSGCGRIHYSLMEKAGYCSDCKPSKVDIDHDSELPADAEREEFVGLLRESTVFTEDEIDNIAMTAKGDSATDVLLACEGLGIGLSDFLIDSLRETFNNKEKPCHNAT
jgi:hypothetical protein